MTALLLAALLSIADPVGDAAGDGTLRPPTSDRIAGTANFDLHRVDLLDGPNLTIAIELGALDNPGELPNGFSHPIVEIYLDTAEGGESDLLPGSGMALPAERGWETALRITGDRAEVIHRSVEGDTVRLPVDLRIEDGVVVVATPLPAPDTESVALFALVGVYDPFTDDGWRPLSVQPSPWAFSSQSQRYPVVDLLALDDTIQRRALQIGFLPLAAAEADRSGIPWLLMMGLGVLVAVVGLGLRSRVRPAATPIDGPLSPAEPDAAVGGAEADLEDASAARSEAPPAPIAAAVSAEPGGPAPSVGALHPPMLEGRAEPASDSSGEAEPRPSVGASAELMGAGPLATGANPGDSAMPAVPTFVIGRAGRGSRPAGEPGAPARSSPVHLDDDEDAPPSVASDDPELEVRSAMRPPTDATSEPEITADIDSADGSEAVDGAQESSRRGDSQTDDAEPIPAPPSPTASEDGSNDPLSSAWDEEAAHAETDSGWSHTWRRRDASNRPDAVEEDGDG